MIRDRGPGAAGDAGPPRLRRDALARLRDADAVHTRALTTDLDTAGALQGARRSVAVLSTAPAPAPEPTARALARRRRLAAAAKVAALVAVGVVLAALGPVPLAAVYAYVVAPLLLVAGWMREGGAQRWTRHHRPRTLAGWAAQVEHDGEVLRAGAETLRRLRRRATELRHRARELRAGCDPADPMSAGLTARLDELMAELTSVRRHLKLLARRVEQAAEQASEFAGTAAADPSAACFDFGHMFVVLDPEPVGTLMRSAALGMKLGSDVGAVIPRSGNAGDDLPAALAALLAETQRCSQATRRMCRRLLDDANDLHTEVAAAVVDGLDTSRAAKIVARVAVHLSPYSRSATKTTSVRTFFARLVSRQARPTVSSVCRAAMTALVRGWNWSAASEHA